MSHRCLIRGHVLERQGAPSGQLPRSPGEQQRVVIELFRRTLARDNCQQGPIEVLSDAGQRYRPQRWRHNETTGFLGNEIAGPRSEQRVEWGIHKRRG